MTVSQNLVRIALDKYKDASTHQLARILYQSDPEVWPNLNSARQAVKRARGANGNRDRHLATHPRPLVNPADLANPFNLPEADILDYPMVHLEGSKFLIINDLHVPYQDNQAITIAINEGRKFGADHLLINGDFIDCFSLSRYDRDPTARSLAGELRCARLLLEALKSAFPKALITYKHGNHESRYRTYLFNKAPELLDLPGMELEEFMKLEELGVRTVKDGLRIKIGALTALHGHEAQAGLIGPVNAARGAFLKFKDSVIVGHHHQTSQHSETTVNDKLISCWSVGCLCQMHPVYARLNRWSQGVALIEVDGSGAFEVQNKRIYQGKAWG